MSTQAIIIKASDFQYPTKAELQEIYQSTPDLPSFGYKSEDSMFSAEDSIHKIYRDNHLQYWDGVLLNRNGALSHTYQNAAVNYMRGVPEKLELFEHQHYINSIHFDYYAEIFYYHFSTVKDTIAQLLNIYYGFNKAVHSIYFDEKFIKKIPNKSVVEAIETFFQDTSLAKEYRNSFTHRTPINYPDTRCSVEWEISKLTYYSAKDSYVRSSVIKANLDSTIKSLAVLLEELKIQLPQEIK